MSRTIRILTVVLVLALPLTAAQEERGFGASNLYNNHTVEVRSSLDGHQKEGAGFVYRSEYVVTAHHVLVQGDDTADVWVRLDEDHDWVEAEIVGRVVRDDVALIHSPDLPESARSLNLSSSGVKEGENVEVVGNPMGEGNEVTGGTVSSLNHSIVTKEGMEIDDSIKIDSYILPGNSGGPIINRDGEVAGIINARKGEDTGFAVPADAIRNILPEPSNETGY